MSFVTFPGLAGNYASTPDVNLLDADTAHLVQGAVVQGSLSTSTWWSGSGTITKVATGGDWFGIRHQATEAGTNRIETGGLSQLVPTPPGSDITLSVTIENNGPTARNIRHALITGGGDALGTYVSVPVGITRLTQVLSIPAGATNDPSDWWIQIQSNDVGDDFTFSEFMAISGDASSQTTFVPSLRIVGDLQVNTRFTCDFSAGDIPYLAAKDGGGTQGYALVMRNDQGRARIDYAKFDATPRVFQSDAVAWTDQQVYEMRYEWDIDAPRVEIFRDNVSIGSSTSAGFAGAGNSDYNAISPLFAGALNAGANPFAGDMYSLSVRDGIGGPIVAQFDAADVGGVL